MSQEQKQQLTNIHNALMNISTKGNDTILMCQCLMALQQVIEEEEKKEEE